MKNTFFILSLLMFIFSCGKEIASAVASNPSNTTTAAWRFTRGTISSDVTNAAKDQLCSSEFGADYVAGTRKDYFGHVASADGDAVVANQSGTLNNGYAIVENLFCIHK